MSSSKRRWLRRIEYCLLGTGVLCAVLCLMAVSYARTGNRVVEGHASYTQAAISRVSVPVDDQVEDKEAVVMGRLEIPQLSLSVPILSNYQATSLLQGVGYIPGTAMPGGLGTLGLAGHRDTFLRPLRKIKPHMVILVTDSDGIYHYLVDTTEIVKPADVDVLDIRSRPELTLITCYPFYYIGAAPMRFIVHAHLVSAQPDHK